MFQENSNQFTQLAIISVIKQMSFQLASKNWQRCGRSGVLRKLVPETEAAATTKARLPIEEC